MYKAIFFDLDGTLTDSGEGITKSVQLQNKVGSGGRDTGYRRGTVWYSSHSD